MKKIKKSHKLDDVCYDIRGLVLQEARRMEEDGHKILKLNIGNPAPFGFEAPEESRFLYQYWKNLVCCVRVGFQ